VATLVGGAGALVTSPATAGAAARTPVAAVATTAVVSKAAAASCATGKYQKQVETYLKKLGGFGTVTVDGKQSAADCAAIKKFQKRFGIKPAAGLAGPTTFDVAKRLASTNVAACKPKKSGITFCVNLTQQTTWIMKNGKKHTNPTVTRTGMKNYRTPAGTFKINKRTKKEWSDPYEVWLPYWQRFIGGRGFHETTTYIHDKWRGSHGCVNLLEQDAKAYWSVGKKGMTVKVIGRRPGT
jgi:peptidoglycan hydrolase-like protein with peptidoglycan-binding domain